jgi:hypothetical protein
MAKYTRTETHIIMAPEGTSIKNDKKNPKNIVIQAKIVAKIIRGSNRFVKSFAVMGGVVKIARVRIGSLTVG